MSGTMTTPISRRMAVFVALVAIAAAAGNRSWAQYCDTWAHPDDKAVAGAPELRHEVWGQTSFGDGYVYGPLDRAAGMSAADMDHDGDFDFFFDTEKGTEYCTNYGTRDLIYFATPAAVTFSGLPEIYVRVHIEDLADVNGDGLVDALCALYPVPETVGEAMLAWMLNTGASNQPAFMFHGTVGTFSGWNDNPFAACLADVNHDGLLDAATFQGSPGNGVATLSVALNTGTLAAPAFGAFELTTMTFTMAVGKQGAPGNRISDAGIGDVDGDGLPDVLLFTTGSGLCWYKNIGTLEAPAWETAVADQGVALYNPRASEGLADAPGTFAFNFDKDVILNSAPGFAAKGQDLFVAAGDKLKTLRRTGAATPFQTAQQLAIALDSGRGPAAFWDYDGDGDPDMFRTANDGGALVLTPNEGTVYSAAWGTPVRIEDVPISLGNAANGYSQDQYVFGDADADSAMDFFVQGQDGHIARYAALPPASAGLPPTFTLTDANFGEVVTEVVEDVVPCGIALVDLDSMKKDAAPHALELLTVYRHAGGASIKMVDVLFGVTADATGLLPGTDGGLLDLTTIQSLAGGDLDMDGQPDLVVSQALGGGETALHWFRNVYGGDLFYFSFEYAGALEVPNATDSLDARYVTLADVDKDRDNDLFVGYEPLDGSAPGRYQRFYRNVGPTYMHYVRYRMVAGEEWPLHLRLTIGTGGDTHEVSVAPDYCILQNASGGQLLDNATWQTGETAPSVDILDTTNLLNDYDFDEVRAFVDVMPAVGANESKAIVIIGGGANDDLYDAFENVAAYAYRVLRSEGLPKANILLLGARDLDADLDDTNDVAGAPSVDALEDALANWAPAPVGSAPLQRLLVYFVDHGRLDGVRLNETDYLDAADYDAMLDALQASECGDKDGGCVQVTTIIDACESGSFVDSIAGPDRITMTSANTGPIEGVALFDKDEGISFSLQFWTRLYNGDTYGQAFRNAKACIEAINPLQVPQLDDDGDGVANTPSDGLMADVTRPGATYSIHAPGIFIGSVAPDQTATSDEALLWVADIVAPLPVEGVKAVVIPPNFDRIPSEGDSEQPVSDLPSVLFDYNAETRRWEGTYTEFTQGGLFQIQYFVKTGGQYYASPRIGFVDRIGIPDAFEQDDTADLAPWATPNELQGHNFDTNGDADWMLFTPPAGTSATIALLNPGPNCRVEAALYRAADLDAEKDAAPVYSAQAEGWGEELVFAHDFDTQEPYLLRVSNADGAVFGAGTSYSVLLAVGTAGTQIIATSVFITVVDSANDAPLAGARVVFAGSGVGNTSADGVVFALAPSYGNYTATATKDGYKSSSQVVNVNNTIESATLYLEEGSDEPNPKGCAVCAPGEPGGRTSWFGDAIAFMLLVAFLAGWRYLVWRGEHDRKAETTAETAEYESSEEIALCPCCLHENAPEAEFCANCFNPLAMTAAIDPIKRIGSVGFMNYRLQRGPISKFLLAGTWLWVFPLFFQAFFFGGTAGFFVGAGVIGLIYAPSLYFVTRHYVIETRMKQGYSFDEPNETHQ